MSQPFCFFTPDVNGECICKSIGGKLGNCIIDPSTDIWAWFILLIVLGLVLHTILLGASGWLMFKMIKEYGTKFRLTVRSTTNAIILLAELFRVLYYAIGPHHAYNDPFEGADGFMYNFPILLWISAINVLYMHYLAAISRATKAEDGAYKVTRIVLFIIIGFVILLVLPIRIAADVMKSSTLQTVSTIGTAVALLVTLPIGLAYNVKVLRIMSQITHASAVFGRYLKRVTFTMLGMNFLFLAFVVLLIVLTVPVPTPHLRVISYCVYRVMESVGVALVLAQLTFRPTSSGGKSGASNAFSGSIDAKDNNKVNEKVASHNMDGSNQSFHDNSGSNLNTATQTHAPSENEAISA